MLDIIKQVTDQFDIKGNLLDIKCKNNGNINKTYIGTYKMMDGSTNRFIFQKINTTVFKEPYKLMKNISGITDWIEDKTKLLNDNKPCLKVIKTKSGNSLATIEDFNGEKMYYRAYNCIDNAITYDRSLDPNIVYNSGKAFGHFQKLLIDYPIEKVEESIPDFHNTKLRYIKFLNDIKEDVCKRCESVKDEIELVKKNESIISSITDLVDNNLIPIRITHNDTKVNNVMIDIDTKDYLTVIDLDTVMLGSCLYDYGDGIRSSASNALEDEEDLAKVYLDNNLFEKYTDGYLSEMAPFLNEYEVSNLGRSIEVLTLELAMRFLNDYINGDTYFKTVKDKHNLIRARNQLKLLSDIQSKMEYINNYTNFSYKKRMNLNE
ncbi:MAG: phosphotransferase [bacterium]|nr:phosphotransferase [bacterium]